MAERYDRLDLGIELPLTPPEPGPKTAQAVLELVRLYPEMHYQGAWFSRQSQPHTTCKTTLCVAGWAQWLHEGLVRDDNDIPGEDVETKATQYLGLNDFNANRLFYATAEDAIRALEFVARGEEIDWDDVRYPASIRG